MDGVFGHVNSSFIYFDKKVFTLKRDSLKRFLGVKLRDGFLQQTNFSKNLPFVS